MKTLSSFTGESNQRKEMNETRNPFPSLSSQVKKRRRKRNQPFSLQFLNQRKESSLELEFPFLKEKKEGTFPGTYFPYE